MPNPRQTWVARPKGSKDSIRTRPVLLYDGDCLFCVRSVRRLRAWAAPDKVEFRSFRDEGSLADVPELTAEACEGAVQLVLPDGTVVSGLPAFVDVVSTRPLGVLARLYHLPGVRHLADAAYRFVARHRHRWSGCQACLSGDCLVHRR